jgi:hypothetical protein
MANHCEKLIKKLIDKNFKQTPTVASAKSSSNEFYIKLNLGKEKTASQETKADLKMEDQSDNEESVTSDLLSMTEKMTVTDRIRKLANEGLAAVNIIHYIIF